MMDESFFFGLAWGALAAGVQHLHLRRSVRRAIESEGPKPSSRVSWTLLGSMLRLVVLIGFFAVAWKITWIRLDISVVAFAVFHLFFMFRLGFGIKSQLESANDSKRD
ncbi:MAG: hypothetical protein H6752_06040 [Candidatus Omnitrophica bacterium]|nr:hypothetical protein [Candidatus Omnitrophota bacterium]MCB9767738.1 hypothetical protein [Candidatus Omnitrophota bacterium]